MNLADELRKLQELRQSGGLSEDEFARAKAAILNSAQTATPVPTPPTAETIEQRARQWAMFIHLSQLAGFLAPLAGLVIPILLWQIRKNELPGTDIHGKIVLNWILSEIVYFIGCVVLVFCLIGIPLLVALLVLGIIFPIIGALKANNGEAWPYPLSIEWLK